MSGGARAGRARAVARRALAALAMASAALVSMARPVAAATGEPVVTISLSTAEVELGRPFDAFVEASVKSGVEISMPTNLQLGAFEEIGRNVVVRHRDQRDFYTFELRLMAFEVGELEIPGLPVVYATSSGAREVRTTPSRIRVRGSAPEDLAQPLEVGPRTVIRRDLDRIYWAAGIAGGAVVLATLLVLLYRSIERYRARKSAIVLSPIDRARRRLSALEQSASLMQPPLRSAYVELSEIVREFLHARLGIAALDATTAEISAALETTSLKDEARAELIRWLRDCDLVKFAGFEPTEDDARETLEIARRWIEAADKAREKELLRARA